MAEVSFSANLKPSSAFEIRRPAPDGKSEETLVARAGSVMLRILTMSREERLEVLAAAADDPIVILFATLRPNERRDVLKAAETFLKEKVTET